MEGKRDHHSGEKGVGSLGEAGEKRGRVLYMVGPKRKEVNFSVELNCVQLGALFSKEPGNHWARKAGLCLVCLHSRFTVK